MKILLVSHEFDIGGSTVSLVSLINGLKEYEEISITVALPIKNGAASRLMKDNNVHFKEMLYRKNYKKIQEKYSLKFRIFDVINFIGTFIMCGFIKKEKFDIVCSNSTGVDVGARAAQLSNVPHIYYVREFMQKDHNCEYRNKKRMKELFENSDYAIFISNAIEQYYCDKYNFKNTICFFNGFLINDYFVENHQILSHMSISFIQVGYFQDGKGTLNTIELLYRLYCAGLKNWDMEFVGNGNEEYIDKMKRMIAEYKLEEYIKIGHFTSDIKSKLGQKDILIMNSRAEAFGRVTVEGMLAGCLVMGRDGSGTTEIIDDGINGVVFKTDSDFIDNIFKIDSKRDYYRKLALNGQNYAVETFDCSNTAKNFMEVLGKIKC